jgi:hypothetical protein
VADDNVPSKIVVGPGEPYPASGNTPFDTSGAPYNEDFLQIITGVSWITGGAGAGAGGGGVVVSGPSAYFAGDDGSYLGYSPDGENWTPLENTLINAGNIFCGGWFRQGFVDTGRPVWLLGGYSQYGTLGVIVYSFNGGADGGFFATLDPVPYGSVDGMSFDPATGSVYAHSATFFGDILQYVSQDGVNWTGTIVSDNDLRKILPGSRSPGTSRANVAFGDDPARNTDFINIFQASRYQAYGIDNSGSQIVIECALTVEQISQGRVLRNGVPIPFFGDSNGVGAVLNSVNCCVSDGQQFFVLGGRDETSTIYKNAVAWSDDGGISWTLVTDVTSVSIAFTLRAIAAGGIAGLQPQEPQPSRPPGFLSGPANFFVGDVSCFLGYSLDGKAWTPLEATILGTGGTVTCGGWFREGFVPEGRPVWVLGGFKSPTSPGAAIVYSLNGGQDGGFLATLIPPPSSIINFIGSVDGMSFDMQSKQAYASLPGGLQYASTDGITWRATGATGVKGVILPGSTSPINFNISSGGDPEQDTANINILQASRDRAYGFNIDDNTPIVISIDYVNGDKIFRNGVLVGTDVCPSLIRDVRCCASDGRKFFVVGGLGGGGSGTNVNFPSIAWSEDGGFTWNVAYKVTSVTTTDTVTGIAVGTIVPG